MFCVLYLCTLQLLDDLSHALENNVAIKNLFSIDARYVKTQYICKCNAIQYVILIYLGILKFRYLCAIRIFSSTASLRRILPEIGRIKKH